MSFIDLPSVTLRQWEALGSSSLSSLPDLLRRCWKRSLALSVNPEGIESEAVATPTLIRERSEVLAPVMEGFAERFGPLAATLSAQHFKLLLTDAEGMVLQEWGGGEFASEADRVRLVRGSLWNEALRGTNAIGTAIAEGSPVAVHGTAHFIKQNHSLVCYAAPIFDADGSLLGVLDATSFLDAAHPSVMASVQATARALEEWLRNRHLQQHATVRTHLLERLLGRFSGPALLVEPTGLVRIANRHALATFAQLSIKEVHTPQQLFVVEHTLESLLGVPLGMVLEPGSRDCYVELGPGLRYRVEVEAFIHGPATPFVLLFERVGAGIREKQQVESPVGVGPFSPLLGDDPVFCATIERAARLARSRLPLLLQSETGTGKEVLARAIHQSSPRADRPFVAINCAALSQELLASELFGYAPNAFTGASPQGRVGHIASAEGGTFFLDEIGETTPSFQAMLLRLLEDGSYYKVGDTVLQRADVRILCATCRNLEEMVADGTFRQDLFYRIRGCVLSLPAVRQRVDFALLVDGLLSLLQEELALEERPVLAGDVLACLAQHDWPGNVRELRHVLHCAVVLAMPSAVLELSHFVDVLPMERCLSVAALPESEADPSLETSKMSAIQRALEQTKGNVSAAARMLGVARSTIYRVLRRQERSDD